MWESAIVMVEPVMNKPPPCARVDKYGTKTWIRTTIKAHAKANERHTHILMTHRHRARQPSSLIAAPAAQYQASHAPALARQMVHKSTLQ